MTENVSISQSILTSLGGGSGIDIFKLARDLADVEKEPKQLAIQSSIDKSEASISGYAAISFQLGVVKSAFESFDDEKKISFLSKQFAAKVAFSKALGTGINKSLRFKDIEILRDEKGKPFFNFNSSSSALLSSFGIVGTHVSLSCLLYTSDAADE